MDNDEEILVDELADLIDPDTDKTEHCSGDSENAAPASSDGELAIHIEKAVEEGTTGIVGLIFIWQKYELVCDTLNSIY